MERLPTELLLQIAAQLDGPTLVTDLTNLALASRRLKGVAQDALYVAPIVEYRRCRRWDDDPTLEPSILLARTMVEQPSLARKMKRLAFKIFNDTSDFKRFMDLPNSPRRSPVDSEDLDVAQLVRGIDADRRGACLEFAPPLEALELLVVNRQDIDAPRLPSVDLFDFDLETTVPKFPAFTKLRSLTTNCPVPWIMISLPTLKSLNLRITTESDPYYDIPSTPGQLKLTSLVVSVDRDILIEDWQLGNTAQSVLAYFTQLMSQARALEDLSIRVTCRWPCHFHDQVEKSWDYVASRIPRLDNLRTLEIDAAEIRVDRIKDEEHMNKIEWSLRIRAAPIVSLERFRNLERLTIPEMALLGDSRIPQGDNKIICHLPHTLKSISIIDSTKMLAQWAKDVWNHRSNFPALSGITLWCDRKSQPLEPLISIDAEESASFENQLELGATLAETLMGYPGTAWDALSDSGIELVAHGRSERLRWRRLQDESRFKLPPEI